MTSMNVSVVIPAFNRPRKLKRAVESVFAQTCRSFELFVVDDASTADLSTVQSTVEKAGHRWIRLPENFGPAAARNAGAAASTGEWIAFLDSDDRWLPEKLERQLAWHEVHSGFEISQCEEAWIRNGEPVYKPKRLHQPSTGRIFDKCVELCCISPSSVMMSRKLWAESGGFDERFRVCEDYELWLRIALNREVGLVPGKFVEKYGGHDDQLSSSVEAIDRWRVLALLENLDRTTGDDRKTVLAGIVTKAGILEAGARKRGLPEEEFYREIRGWAEAGEGSPAAMFADGLTANLAYPEK